MEKKVGEVFRDNGKTIKVIVGKECEGCIYKGAFKPSCKKDGEKIGYCYEGLRSDNTSIIFVEI